MTVGLNEPVASLTRVRASSVPSTRRRVGRQRIRLLLIAGLALAVGSATLVYQRSSARAMHDYDGGPVRTSSATTTSLVADVGQVVTFGGIILENFSKNP